MNGEGLADVTSGSAHGGTCSCPCSMVCFIGAEAVSCPPDPYILLFGLAQVGGTQEFHRDDLRWGNESENKVRSCP